MTRWERRSFNLLAAVVTLSGFAYLWMKYLVQSTDPFSVVNHPWQTTMLAMHVVASPAFILVSGVIFNSHVMRKLRVGQRPNRRSGYASLGTFVTMLLSGYGLQISTNERWLQVLVIVHLSSGVVFSVAYAAHLLIAAAMARKQPRAALSEVA
jgi:hypothetical protein